MCENNFPVPARCKPLLRGLSASDLPGLFYQDYSAGAAQPEWLNVLSGLAEIVIGVYLLKPRTRVYAAWGAIAPAIAVFQANVHMYLANVGPDGPGTGNPTVNPVHHPRRSAELLLQQPPGNLQTATPGRCASTFGFESPAVSHGPVRPNRESISPG